jgi:hypothetical protein
LEIRIQRTAAALRYLEKADSLGAHVAPEYAAALNKALSTEAASQ